MRRHLMILILIFLLAVSEIHASGTLKKFSISLEPTGILAIGGHYNDSTKLNEALNVGLGLELGLRYEINENVYANVAYSYDWLSVKEDYRPFDYEHRNPAFEMQALSLNGFFFLKSGFFIEPYLTLGAGVSFWKFSGDALGVGVWSAPGNPEESFSDSSPLLNIGVGVEVFAWSHFVFCCEVKYNYLFSKNQTKFGTDDFTQQDFLTLSIGVIFNLGKK